MRLERDAREDDLAGEWLAARELEEGFAGDTVELICQIEEDGCSCGRGVRGVGSCDVFFNLELHGVDDEVCAVWGADSIIIWEHVTCKFFPECVGDVTGYEATNGGGDSEGS